jgi:hypothetical protein
MPGKFLSIVVGDGVAVRVRPQECDRFLVGVFGCLFSQESQSRELRLTIDDRQDHGLMGTSSDCVSLEVTSALSRVDDLRSIFDKDTIENLSLIWPIFQVLHSSSLPPGLAKLSPEIAPE